MNDTVTFPTKSHTGKERTLNRLFRNLAMFAAVIAGGFIATPVQASKPAAGVMIVDDAAGLFSKDAVVKAKDTFHDTTFQSPTHYAVVTISRVPESKKTELEAIVKAKNKDDNSRFFNNLAREMARSKDSKGDVFTLIYKDASSTMFHVSTISDKQSDVFRGFNDAKAGDVNKLYIDALRKVKDGKLAGDEAKKELDAALTPATQIVIDDLKDTAAPDKKTGRTNNSVTKAAGGSNIMSYVCIGIVALLGIWLVVGLIRAFTGGGGGGGNGGGGYGGGGGGGGGFMSGLMGGMLGGMAGAYLYNNMFGGGMHNDAMAGDSYNNGNNDSGNTDTGDGDYSSGAESGDGDFGDAGGGDTGGGGDWGGGDTGGGGDFGGGGGDW